MEARKQFLLPNIAVVESEAKISSQFAQRCLRLNGRDHSAERYLHIHARLTPDALICGMLSIVLSLVMATSFKFDLFAIC
jgi:hypothetical protein